MYGRGANRTGLLVYSRTCRNKSLMHVTVTLRCKKQEDYEKSNKRVPSNLKATELLLKDQMRGTNGVTFSDRSVGPAQPGTCGCQPAPTTRQGVQSLTFRHQRGPRLTGRQNLALALTS